MIWFQPKMKDLVSRLKLDVRIYSKYLILFSHIPVPIGIELNFFSAYFFRLLFICLFDLVCDLKFAFAISIITIFAFDCIFLYQIQRQFEEKKISIVDQQMGFFELLSTLIGKAIGIL